jgi:tetratricopeptide (TPR) repeat protein
VAEPADTDRTTIGGFHSVHRVAQSYLGSLWIALDKRAGEPGKPVLLRRLQLPSDTPAEARLHVARAGRDALELRHPNLLSVIEVLEEGQEIGVAHEHVEAEPLRSLQSWANLRGLTFPIGVSLAILADLLRGLGALHAIAGTASVSPFGGLSPDSVLVTRAGDARLCDSLVASCASLLESIGANTAKLGYAAPEQVHAVAPLTPAADVFACGAMLWELLAARRLLSGSRPAIERKLLEHSLPNLASSLRGDQQVTSDLLDLVGRALSHDPGKRPAPEAMLEQLRHCGHELASREQVAQFVGKLSGQRLDRRNAAVRSKSLPELQAPLEWPLEVPASKSSSSRKGARPAAAPSSNPQTAPSAAPSLPLSSSASSHLAAAPAAPASRAFASPNPVHQRLAPAGLPPATPQPGAALAASPPVAVHAPAEPRPITARMGAPAPSGAVRKPSGPGRKPSPSFVEPPPIPDSFPMDDEESDATIREPSPEDWLSQQAGTAPLTPAVSSEAPSAAPAVPIVPAAVGRRTVAGVGKPPHPVLGATLPFANLTPGPFAARVAATDAAATAASAPAGSAQATASQPLGMAQGPAVSPPPALMPPAAPAQSIATAQPMVSAQPMPAAQPLVSGRPVPSVPPVSSVLPSSNTLHSLRVAPPLSSVPAPSAGVRSLPPGMPSLRGYEPIFALAPEELVPRVAPSARVTRPRSGWERALGLGPGNAGRGRALLAGTAACVALAAAIVVVLLLRRPAASLAPALDGLAAAQDLPARELARPAEPAEPVDDQEQVDPEGAAPEAADPNAAAIAQAPDAAVPLAVAPGPRIELAGNLASAQLDDRQLLQLFALEQYEPWPSCPERAAASKTARNAKKNSAREAKEAVRLLKAARGELLHGSNEKAQSLLCRATAHDPSNSQAQQALAELALRFGSAPQAQAAIEKALARKPEDPTLLGILGDALALSGDLPGSRRVWLRALPSTGSEEERVRLLAGTYRKLGDRLLGSSSYAAACALFRRALVLSEGSYAPSIGLAESLRRLHQPRAALAWAERAANAFSNDPRVQLLLGDILYDNGQKLEARSAWRAARKAQPSNALAAQRLAKGKP